MVVPKKNNPGNEQHKLSILIGQDGLSFYVADLSNNQIILFAKKDFGKLLEPSEILEQVEQLFDQYEELASVGKAQVLFSNNLYAFVPDAFFDENHLSDYLKFNTKILRTDFIAYDELVEPKLNNVYIPYTNINNYFFDKFGSFQYEHATSILVKNMLLQEKEAQQEKVYVNVFSRHFDMVVLKNDKLLLCNSFYFEAPEDFVYYILFTAEQLKLDPEKFSLVFLGTISAESEIYKLCYTYIRNCSFFEEENAGFKEFDFSKFPQANPNYVLLNSFLCE